MPSREDRFSEMDDDALRADAAPRSLRGRMCFGAAVGLLAGPTSGWTSCWLVEAMDLVGLALAIGAVLGLFGGVGIACFQARRFPGSINPDIATFVCIAYALVPAILTLCGALYEVHGKVTGYLAVGTAFAFPAGAALVGALFDRVAEAVFRGGDGPTAD